MRGDEGVVASRGAEHSGHDLGALVSDTTDLPTKHDRPEATGDRSTASIETQGEESLVDSAQLAPGTRVDRYVLLECIGAGGMGVVYAAFDPRLRRRVAIKLLAKDRRESFLSRMLREAEGLAQLNHPNVVAVYDSGVFSGGLFIAMEFVDGVPLSAWQKVRGRSQEEIVEAYVSAGRGLAAAHAAGLVHRDFKPDNVLVGHDGRVRVIDFGLVKANETASSMEESLQLVQDAAKSEPLEGFRKSEAVTRVGTRMGTPRYMSPEQHVGENADERSDQFSFCLSLCDALTLKSPFDYKAFIAAIKAEETPAPATVRPDALPRHVTRALEKGLSLDPGDRFATMDELLSALDAKPSRPTRALWLGAFLLLGVGGLAAYSLRDSPNEQCRARATSFTQLWTESTQKQVDAAFRGAASTYGAETFVRLNERMRALVLALQAEHRGACDATYQDYTQSAVQLDARMSCLRRKRARVTVLLEAWREPERRHVDHALEALEKVADDGECAGVEAVSAQAESKRVEPDVWLRYQSALDRSIAEEALGNAKAAFSAVAPLVDEIPRELPRMKARLNLHAGMALKSLSRVNEALPRLVSARALAIRGGDEGGASEALLELADAHMLAGHYAVAEALLVTHRARVVDVPERVRAALHFHQLLGRLHEDLGRMDDAEREHEAGMALALRSFGPLEQAKAKAYLGVLRAEQGRFAEALLLTREAYHAYQERLGEENPSTITWRTYYAQSLGSLGRYREALTHFRAILSLDLERFGATHNDVALDRAYIAESAQALGNMDEALEQRLKAHRIFSDLFGETHVHAASELALIAQLYGLVGRRDEARATFDRALKLLEKSEAGEGYSIDAFTASALFHLAEGEGDVARGHIASAIELSTKHYGEPHITTARTLAVMSRVRLAQKQAEDALAWAIRARDALPEAGSPPVEELAEVWVALGRALQQLPGAPGALRSQVVDELSQLLPELRRSEVSEARALSKEAASLTDAL